MAAVSNIKERIRKACYLRLGREKLTKAQGTGSEKRRCLSGEVCGLEVSVELCRE